VIAREGPAKEMIAIEQSIATTRATAPILEMIFFITNCPFFFSHKAKFFVFLFLHIYENAVRAEGRFRVFIFGLLLFSL
jgi:hypothetical protein